MGTEPSPVEEMVPPALAGWSAGRVKDWVRGLRLPHGPLIVRYFQSENINGRLLLEYEFEDFESEIRIPVEELATLWERVVVLKAMVSDAVADGWDTDEAEAEEEIALRTSIVHHAGGGVLRTTAAVTALTTPSAATWAASNSPKFPYLAQMPRDCLCAVCEKLCREKSGGAYMLRLGQCCRALRDALVSSPDPEVTALWEIAACSKFIAELEELLPSSIDDLQEATPDLIKLHKAPERVLQLRLEARSVFGFDRGPDILRTQSAPPSHHHPSLGIAPPIDTVSVDTPACQAYGCVPPILRPSEVGIDAYRRLHSLRNEFCQRVRVMRGSIAALDFRVDAIVLPGTKYFWLAMCYIILLVFVSFVFNSMLTAGNEIPRDVGFGAGGAVFNAANGKDGTYSPYLNPGPLDDYMRQHYPDSLLPTSTVIATPSFNMSPKQVCLYCVYRFSSSHS